MAKLISDISEIGAALRTRRESRKQSLTEVAAILGMPRSTLIRIENGSTSPTWSTVLAISQALDLQPVLVPREKMPAVDAVLKISNAPEAPPLAGEDWD